MAISTATASAPHVHDCDRTDTRIRAFLASIRPQPDRCLPADTEARMYRGHALIEQLAAHSDGGDAPSLALSVAEVADVLTLLHFSEPVQPATWWKDDAEVSHLCGLDYIMEALEDSLREPGSAEAPGQKALPMRTDRIGPAVSRIYEAASVIELAERAVQRFSGDEDALKIVEELSVPAGAIRTARALLLEVAERLEMVAHEAEGETSPD